MHCVSKCFILLVNEVISDMKFNKLINGVQITANEEMSDQDCRNYIAWAREKNPGHVIESMNLEFDGEEVGVEYKTAPVPFEKIRRITGYLVGTLDRFNDAKAAEEHDRVKHTI